MFAQTWKKYLPAIAILIKRSAKSEQVLNMNHTDFERAAGGKKVRFGFSGLQLNNGRMENAGRLSPSAKEFAQVITENDITGPLIKKQQFEFSMNSDFQLLIKNNTSPVNDIPVNGVKET